MARRTQLSLAEARRLALAAQGFDRPRPKRVGPARLAATIRRLGLLQLDFVNVLVPAHYQVPFSRLGPYDRAHLDALVYRRREFTEQWAHEASIVPVEHWPLLRHRRETHRVRPWNFQGFLERHPRYVQQVLEDVRARGPLTADDLTLPEGAQARWGGDWRRSAQRCVLEAHFGFGRLAVAGRRRDFSREYDVPERVVAAEHLRPRPDRDEQLRALLTVAARAHGVATAGDLADYHRTPVRDVRPRLAELVEAGALSAVRVEGWREPAYLHPGASTPRRVAATSLLSPFDPLIWTRRRTARLFGLDYVLEIFVPSAKRRWGYYVLPFLMGERFVARVDLKADRGARALRVPAAYLEPDADARAVVPALARELAAWAGWLGLETVRVGRRGSLARALADAVRAHR